MSDIRPTFKDILSSIPGIFGIRLEEEPAYDVLDTIEDVEVRRYRPAVLAQVTISGDHDSALDQAFEKLAGYIYGENSANEKMGMTSPVFQALRGEKMEMTTPVMQSAEGDGWTVAFFLSNALDEATAPKPKDPAVKIVSQPETTLASLRFSGNNSIESRAKAKQELLAALAGSARWRVMDDVSWAQYDQPFAIPFLKRNEAHVAVAEKIGFAM